MNNQNSSGSQIFRFLLLGLAGYFLWNSFNAQKNQTPATPPRPAPALVEAFNNIAPAQGAPLTKATAPAEIARLQKFVTANPKDALANWSQLRIGLINQYITGNLKEAQRSGGILGFGPKVNYFPAYDAVVQNAANDAVEAQALYQVADLQWRRSVEQPGKGVEGGKASGESVTDLQALWTRGRGSSPFLKEEIYVPKSVVGDNPADPRLVPLVGVPPGGFVGVKVGELRGTLANPNPAGIIDRVDAYYRSSVFYKVFDMMVQVLGNNRTYSYGLAILIFAVFLRAVMQPIYKRQYDSMKGMALIAPEMKKIQDKYKDNKDPSAQMAMMKEIRATQASHGVNPMTGCGLSLIQLPVLFFIVYPFIQHYEPHMELAGASFLWINSLAHPDIPLLVLYGISQFVSTRIMATPPADDMQRQQQLIMGFLMPVIFPFFLLAYPSAFTLYWMASNVMNMVFLWRSIKAANPDKSMMKTLMGADLVVANANADAVPSRPGSDAKREKPALQAGKTGLDLDKIAGSNGHMNGHSNGVNGLNGGAQNGGLQNGGGEHHAAPEGSVLKPSENNGGNNTKGGGRRGKKKR